MQIRKSIIAILVVLSFVIYMLATISIDDGYVHNISIDLGRPLHIVWPCEVAIVGDDGEKGLRIAPNIGNGWDGKAGGESRYQFYVPKGGTFYTWTYCRWFDECSNAIFAQIDEFEKSILGNDPVYGQWHWVKGFEISLKQGTHIITLSNHSDHVSLQKILLTNSSSAMPDDCGIIFSDIFYDGFDGCDQGNFLTWEQISGHWLVQTPESKKSWEIGDLLKGVSEDSALILRRNDDWTDYSLSVSLKFDQFDNDKGGVGVCFGVTAEDRYYQLMLCPIHNTRNVEMTIFHVIGQDRNVLTRHEILYNNNDWNHVTIRHDAKTIKAKLNDSKELSFPLQQSISGGIGLSIEGNGSVLFDNVHVRNIDDGA